MHIAYCWRSGQIEIGNTIPEGCAELARDEIRERLEGVIGVLARHSYDGETLLVPGLPEAEDDDAAYGAVVRFINEASFRLGADT